MSFPRAPLKRFNESVGCAPGPGAYEMKPGEVKHAASFHRAERFKPIRASAGQPWSAKDVPASPVRRSVSVDGLESPGWKNDKAGVSLQAKQQRLLEKEIRTLLHQRAEQDRRLQALEEDMRRLEGKLLNAVREKTGLSANVASLERQLGDLRKANEFLKTKVSSDVSKKRINSLSLDLLEAKNNLDSKDKELSYLRISTEGQVKVLEADLEAQRSTLQALRERTRDLEDLHQETKTQNEELESEVDKLHGVIQCLRDEVRVLQGYLDTANEEIQDLRLKLQEKEKMDVWVSQSVTQKRDLQNQLEQQTQELKDSQNALRQMQQQLEQRTQELQESQNALGQMGQHLEQSAEELRRSQGALGQQEQEMGQLREVLRRTEEELDQRVALLGERCVFLEQERGRAQEEGLKQALELQAELSSAEERTRCEEERRRQLEELCAQQGELLRQEKEQVTSLASLVERLKGDKEAERQQVEAERKQLEAGLEAERQQMDAERKQLKGELEVERKQLKEGFEAELQQLKGELEVEHQRMEAERQQLKGELEAERQRMEAERQQLKAGLEAERWQLEAELEEVLEELSEMEAQEQRAEEVQQELQQRLKEAQVQLQRKNAELESREERHLQAVRKLQEDHSASLRKIGELSTELESTKKHLGEELGRAKSGRQELEEVVRKMTEQQEEERVLWQEERLSQDKAKEEFARRLLEVQTRLAQEEEAYAKEVRELQERLEEVLREKQEAQRRALEREEAQRSALEREAAQRAAEIEQLQQEVKELRQRMQEEREEAQRRLAEAVEKSVPAADETEAWRECYEELYAKVKPFQEQLDSFAAERNALMNENGATQEELNRLADAYARLLGHQNQKQKIKHVVKLKEENMGFKQEVLRLRTQVGKLKKDLEQLSSSGAPRRFDPSKAFKHESKENQQPHTPLGHGNQNLL